MERMSWSNAQTDRGSEPFALTRVRDSFGEWFHTPPRHTVPSFAHYESLLGIKEPMVVVRGTGESHPAATGAISGFAGGIAMLTVAALASREDLPTMFGTLFSRGNFAGNTAFIYGWIVMGAIGAILGTGFGQLTRRLRNLPALLCFGMLLSFSTWMFLHLVVLSHVAPGVAASLPRVPMLLGSIVFGLVTALELPLRLHKKNAIT